MGQSCSHEAFSPERRQIPTKQLHPSSHTGKPGKGLWGIEIQFFKSYGQIKVKGGSSASAGGWRLELAKKGANRRHIPKTCGQREKTEEPKKACGWRPGKREFGVTQEGQAGVRILEPDRSQEATESLDESVFVFEGVAGANFK